MRAKERGLTLLGPAPSPLAMLRGRKRFQCLVKSRDWTSIRSLYLDTLAQCKIKYLRPRLDLDPMNML